MPDVSVIIPFFNTGELLHRTVKSVLEQTFRSIEIILIDDGSTDNSLQLAQQYVSDTVIIISQPNAGAAVARNNGFQYANGTFIQFLDAGDIISKDKVAVQVEALRKEPGKVAVCNYKQFTSDDELFNGIYPDQSSFIFSSDDPQNFLINLWGGYRSMNFIQTNCWLIPKRIVERAGKWRPYRCPDDDGEFFARVILESEGIIYTPDVMNYYHITPGGINQLSKSKSKKYLQNSLLTISLKHQYLLKKGPDPLIPKAIAAQYLRFSVDLFPSQKILSAIAYKRYKSLKTKAELPLIGGRFIEIVKKLFGWKIARYVRFYTREN